MEGSLLGARRHSLRMRFCRSSLKITTSCKSHGVMVCNLSDQQSASLSNSQSVQPLVANQTLHLHKAG